MPTLGYMASKSGIVPLPKKLEALRELKQPTFQRDLLHFCGARNYFRTSLKRVQTTDEGFKSAAKVLQPLYAIGTDKLPAKSNFSTSHISTNLSKHHNGPFLPAYIRKAG